MIAVRFAILALALAVAAPAATPAAAAAQDPDVVREIQERARAATTPGEHHEALERFIGEWDVELELVLPGAPARHAAGRATYEWLLPGRWIAQTMTDDLFGDDNQSFAIMGYDNFAKSYIIAGASSFDTAFNVARGPVVDPDGQVIVTYGTLDEYLTGELHKPYKIVTRIIDRDHHVVETWDLGIGPEGAKVLEYRYSRR